MITRLDPYRSDGKTEIRHKKTLDYLRGRVHGSILDVGPRNLLTDKMSVFGQIDNTTGDLDTDFTTPQDHYDTIIYSHTIEHQFNPLFTLLKLKEMMCGSMMYIFVPRRTKILWTKYHYHEIDDYRMRLLLERAGLTLVETKYFKTWRKPMWKYFTGIRMVLRLFLEFDVVYCVCDNNMDLYIEKLNGKEFQE